MKSLTNSLDIYVHIHHNSERVDKAIVAVTRDQQAVNEEINELENANKDYDSQNSQLDKDLEKCQAHLQNIMRHNVLIQE